VEDCDKRKLIDDTTHVCSLLSRTRVDASVVLLHRNIPGHHDLRMVTGQLE